jgi:hypothetical protein
MKAARFHAREDVRIDDLPEPESREGTVKWAALPVAGDPLLEAVDLQRGQVGPG